MKLTEKEARALLLRLAARQVADDAWLYWGDVPELDEASYDLLCAALSTFAEELYHLAQQNDVATGIDSADLLERAS